MTSLRAQNISFSYTPGKHAIIEDVSLELESGKIYGLIGANGSGKSTLLQLLSGHLAPQSGQIVHGDTHIMNLHPEKRAKLISFHPQDPQAPEFLTVREIVEMAVYYGATRSEAVETALERLSLQGIHDATLGHLSGGEQQRVFLARTLAQGAPVTLWDEPMTNLDPAFQLQTGQVLAELAQEGRIVLASFHDLSLAANLCSELVCFQSGKVPITGPVSEILQKAKLHDIFGVNFAIHHDSTGWFVRVVI